MELRRYLDLAARWWWLVILGAVLAGSSAYLVSKRITPIYRTSATVLVDQSRQATTDYNSILVSERLTQTYAEWLRKRPVLDEVVARLHGTVDAQALSGMVSVAPVRNTQFLMITVEDTDPVRSATIANLLPEIFRRQSSALQAQRFVDTKAGLDGQLNSVRADIVETRAALAAAQAAEDSSEGSRLEASLQQFQAAEGSLVKSLNDVRLEEAKTTNSLYPIEPAEVPVDPIRPRTAQNTLLAALVGAMLAIGVVLLLEYLNDVLQSPDDVQTSLGLTTLASVPLLTGSPLDAVTMNQRGQTAGGEAYRILRTNLQFAALGRPLRVLQITSPSPSEGKSLTSTNLAIALAQNGQRVILVDCDLRKPHLHHLLNLPNSIGLTIALLDADATPATFLQESGMPGLQVMTSGPLPPNPAEILGTSRMREVLAGLAAEADVLLLDSPPTLAVADAAILASQVDGVLFVVDASSTRREQARQALLSLEQVQVRPVGVVLNRVPQRRSGYYYYYSHNDYGDGEDTGRRRGRRRWPWQKTFRRETQEEAGAVALDS